MPLLVVTATYSRSGRLDMLAHLKTHLDTRRDVTWIVVEDAAAADPEVAAFLPDYAIYLNIGPTRDFGHAQRNLALEYIADNALRGIVYNADDDNKYDAALFDELLQTTRVSFFPVGNLGPHGVERPIILNGKFVRWDANWLSRRFPVDMAGFAFNSELLAGLHKPFWTHSGRGGESEFISKLITGPEEAEFLCNRCTDVLVWWNALRTVC